MVNTAVIYYVMQERFGFLLKKLQTKTQTSFCPSMCDPAHIAICPGPCPAAHKFIMENWPLIQQQLTLLN